MRKALQMIRRLDISTSYPLLLNFFALYDENAITKKNLFLYWRLLKIILYEGLFVVYPLIS